MLLAKGLVMSQSLPTSVAHEQPVAPSGLPGGVLLFRALTEHIPDAAVFVLDEHFRYVLAGGSGLHDAGLCPSDFEGKHLIDVIPDELLSQYIADYTAIFAGGTFLREHSVGARFYRTRGRLIKGINGRADLALAISYDITNEQQVAEIGQF
jgi:PAS domain-containing protein